MRKILWCIGAAAITLLLQTGADAHNELSFSVQVVDTPGLPGFQTYEVTASIDDGYFNTFDFYGADESGGSRGITGPLYQAPVERSSTPFVANSQDSGFLDDPSLGLGIGLSESIESVVGAFSFIGIGLGEHHQRYTHRNWTFARLTTNAPDQVRLNGAMLSERWYSDGVGDIGVSIGDRLVGYQFDINLSDIAIGPPPELGDFPDRPLPPVIPTPPEPMPTPKPTVPPLGANVTPESSEPPPESNFTRPPTTEVPPTQEPPASVETTTEVTPEAIPISPPEVEALPPEVQPTESETPDAPPTATTSTTRTSPTSVGGVEGGVEDEAVDEERTIFEPMLMTYYSTGVAYPPPLTDLLIDPIESIPHEWGCSYWEGLSHIDLRVDPVSSAAINFNYFMPDRDTIRVTTTPEPSAGLLAVLALSISLTAGGRTRRRQLH